MFPQQIYVQRNAPPEHFDTYLMAHETEADVCNAGLDDGEAGECVGVYEFVKAIKLVERTSYVQSDLPDVLPVAK